MIASSERHTYYRRSQLLFHSRMSDNERYDKSITHDGTTVLGMKEFGSVKLLSNLKHKN